MTLLIRPRVADDLPRLVEVLAAQQPMSGYPHRWPLPFPAEEFLSRPGELHACVAVVDDVVVGQVTATAMVDDDFARVCVDALGVPLADLAAVASFFVDPATRGLGVGRALLAETVAWIRAAGRLPVLDVVPAHAPAVALYRGSGWREIGRARPDWLPTEDPSVIVMVLDPSA